MKLQEDVQQSQPKQVKVTTIAKYFEMGQKDNKRVVRKGNMKNKQKTTLLCARLRQMKQPCIVHSLAQRGHSRISGQSNQ